MRKRQRKKNAKSAIAWMRHATKVINGFCEALKMHKARIILR